MSMDAEQAEGTVHETAMQEVDWQEMGQRVLEQTVDLWIRPEIERRRQRGVISDSFQLLGAQIIFDLDAGAPIVRLNDEVLAVLRGRAKRTPIEKGQVITENDIDPEMILLTDKDPNAGHITVLRHKDTWLISFDFRRNAGRVAETIAVAKEYLAVAAKALEDGHLRVFCDLLFAAAELTAKGELIMLPDRTLVESHSHEYLSSRYNSWGKLGNTDPEYVSLLNRLFAMRPTARYLAGPFGLTEESARGMLHTAKAALVRLERMTPARFPSEEIRDVVQIKPRSNQPDTGPAK